MIDENGARRPLEKILPTPMPSPRVLEHIAVIVSQHFCDYIID